jgi:hypothetical protein
LLLIDISGCLFRSCREPDIDIFSGLVRAYLALSKCKDALFTAREAMKVMHQSAKALKLVGDVHAISSSGREKVNCRSAESLCIFYDLILYTFSCNCTVWQVIYVVVLCTYFPGKEVL